MKNITSRDSEIKLGGIPGLIGMFENLFSKGIFGSGFTLNVYMSNKKLLEPYAQFFEFSLKPSDCICIQPYYRSEPSPIEFLPVTGYSYFMKTRLNKITGEVEWMTAKHPMNKLEIVPENEWTSQLQWPASSIIGALGLMYTETAIFRDWNRMWRTPISYSAFNEEEINSRIVKLIVTANDERLFKHPVIKFFELLDMPIQKIQKQK